MALEIKTSSGGRVEKTKLDRGSFIIEPKSDAFIRVRGIPGTFRGITASSGESCDRVIFTQRRPSWLKKKLTETYGTVSFVMEDSEINDHPINIYRGALGRFRIGRKTEVTRPENVTVETKIVTQ